MQNVRQASKWLRTIQHFFVATVDADVDIDVDLARPLTSNRLSGLASKRHGCPVHTLLNRHSKPSESVGVRAAEEPYAQL